MRAACLAKNDGKNVVEAIEKFCKDTKIVAPGSIAGQGASGGPEGMHAYTKIFGTCSPLQWVPQHYCYKQFYWMCWQGNNRGSIEHKYGRKQCQTWVISN